MASYILRDIDRDLWQRAKEKASQQNQSLKAVIESLIAVWLRECERRDNFARTSCPDEFRPPKAPYGQS